MTKLPQTIPNRPLQENFDDIVKQRDALGVRVAALETRVLVLETLEAVHYVGAAGEIAFQNSWVNVDAGGTPPSGTQRHARYWRSRNCVYLNGAIKTGVSNTVAFTLPTGFRPQAARTIPVVANNGAAEIIIGTDGTVKPVDVAALGGTVTTAAFLDGVSFPLG